MNSIKPQLFMFGFSLLPYLLVSWGYTELVDGNSKTFWIALVALVVARLFFSIIETLGSVLSWRLYGRRFVVQKFLGMLQANDFPKRLYADDDVSNYLARIEDGWEYAENGKEISPSLKSLAKQLEFMLAAFEELGILLGARVFSAAERALDLYSPRSEAKEFR